MSGDAALRMARAGGAGGPQVQGFAAGGFRVDGAVHPAVLLTPLWARRWAPPATLGADALDALLALEPPPEFVLLGTGARLVRPPAALAEALAARGVGIEAMDSRAAARAWGVLRAEDRWIAAALIGL